MKSVCSEKIIYRNYKDGDEKDIVNLFNSVFKSEYTLYRWRWEYKENYIDRIDIILAFYGLKFIGQSCGMPLLFIQNDKIARASRIQNVMVHPDFRKNGIFLETLKKLTGYLSRNKVDFIFAFPNDYSIGAFTDKLNYKHLVDISTISLPIKATEKYLKSDLKFDFEENINFKQFDSDFINSQLKLFKIFNARNLDYLYWRYHRNSKKKYCTVRVFDKGEQIGFAICKSYLPTMSIDLVEFIFKNDAFIIRSALSEICNYYKKDNMELFSIWSMEHYPEYQILLDMGFTKTGQTTHVVYKTVSDKYSINYERISSYYLSMGDSDVY